jgi:subtilase family protein
VPGPPSDEEDAMSSTRRLALRLRRDVAAALTGNRRRTAYDSAFTARVAGFPRVAYHPLPAGGCRTAVIFVVDELLVGAAAAADPAIRTHLQSLGAFDTHGTVFGGLAVPPSEDVQIWRLGPAPGDHAVPDVTTVVWGIRPLLGSQNIDRGQVAPNHVLVPSNWHTCPWGPPEEATVTGTLAAQAAPEVHVTVIDAGFAPESPIASWIEQPVHSGQWFTATASASGQYGSPYTWTSEASEMHDANNDGALDTLVAHADFVAGVIAQACPRARITVVDHNGAFVADDNADTPISTEASVARSLWEHRTAQLINVGFAFPTLPSAQSVANLTEASGPPSWTFQLALQGTDPNLTVVVAPAGNQSCPIPQYPAAFHAVTGHPNVVGVGSVGVNGERSVFSNFGPWVACCANGEKVLSTFISDWDGPTEEPEWTGGPNPVKHFGSGWARWSGTSFAAPKVGAAIANKVGPTTSPLDAWLSLEAEHAVGNVEMGRMMKDLPPLA